MATIRQQFRNNAVALISLFIAVTSLAYNTWRNETTEEQRNLRHAAFTVLEHLGQVQEVADARYYYLARGDEIAPEGELRLQGWGSVIMIRDLMNLMPQPTPRAGKKLFEAWREHFGALDDVDSSGRHTAAADEAQKKVHAAIEEARTAVIEMIRALD